MLGLPDEGAANRMKLALEQLAQRLARGMAPLYVLCGDEPLLVDEALELLRARAREQGCGEREMHVAERGFDWDSFAVGLQNMSLFASRRLVELRLPSGKPGDAGARFLTALAANPDTGNVVVVILPRLDGASARSKWATALGQAAVWVEIKSLARGELPRWLRQRLQKRGLSADEDALDLLAALVEGNLLAASQEIDKLALLAETERMTVDAVRASVADGARFDVFELADAALVGDTPRAMRVLRGLQREGEPEALVLWALARETLTLAEVVMRVHGGAKLDAALQEAGVWRSRQEPMRRAARNRRVADVARLVASAARADRIVKGVQPGDPWKALCELALQLSGAGAPLAETA